jgi:hypothetical protein
VIVSMKSRAGEGIDKTRKTEHSEHPGICWTTKGNMKDTKIKSSPVGNLYPM